ncbi:Ras-related protein [Schistosoma japonicum]|uniref:Ras-related protein n=1 Tax=Schistosoma japonicum TaxID=6182 RepID=A0A4Z2D7Y1_SCHJA|nr:Ras-related protein [Schistosoma japonicum]
MSQDSASISLPTFKLLLIGDSCVGKTSLLIRFKDGIFLKGSYISTVGIDYKTKTVKANDQLVRLQIWDTAGQEKFRSLTKSYYRDTSAVLLVYDMCKMDSFANIKSWMSEISANIQSTNILIVLVGNKLDDEKNRMVSKKDGERLAKQNDALFWETSAKTGANVESMFHYVAEHLLEMKTLNNVTSSTLSLQQFNGINTTINSIDNSAMKSSIRSNSIKQSHFNCCPI